MLSSLRRKVALRCFIQNQAPPAAAPGGPGSRRAPPRIRPTPPDFSSSAGMAGTGVGAGLFLLGFYRPVAQGSGVFNRCGAEELLSCNLALCWASGLAIVPPRIGYRLGTWASVRQGLRFGLLFLHGFRGLRSGFADSGCSAFHLRHNAGTPSAFACAHAAAPSAWCFASIGVGSHTHQSPGFIQFHRRHIVRKRRLKT